MTVITIDTRRYAGIIIYVLGLATLIADHLIFTGHELAYPLKMAIGALGAYAGSRLIANREDFAGSISLQMIAAGMFFLAASNYAFLQFATHVPAPTPETSAMPRLQTTLGTSLLCIGAAIATIQRHKVHVQESEDGQR